MPLTWSLLLKSGLMTLAILGACILPLVLAKYLSGKALLAIVLVIAIGGLWRLNYSWLRKD
jgi:hypothetical protein